MKGIIKPLTLQRRVFLAGLASVPALRAAGASTAAYDVAIVGAGAAGISAALQAHRSGLRAIVLEARGRVGGRAVTDEIALGLPFDIGASFLHSAEVNPLFEVAKAHDISTVLSNRYDAEFRERGSASSASAATLYKNAEKRLTERIDALTHNGGDTSLAAAANDPWTRKVANLLAAVDFNSPPERTSVLDIAGFVKGSDCTLPGGLGTFIASLATGLDVRMRSVVRQIDTSGNGVKVSGNFGTLVARGCIVTVPTSLLASGGINFTPPLPAMVTDAFASLPLGLMLKIGFRLKRRIASTEYVVANGEAEAGHANAIRFDPQLPVATVFTGAQTAIDVSRGGIGAKLAFGRAVLIDAFGSQAARYIEHETASAWENDIWARGAYSYALPGKSSARQDYGALIDDKLTFAGEAGGGDLAQTVGGAWRSGANAAQMLAAQLST